MKKTLATLLTLALAVSSITCTAFADDGTHAGTAADLDGTQDQTVTQYYTVAQDGDTEYTDVKNVQLDWETTDINVKYKETKKWNPHDRKWDVTRDAVKDYTKGAGSFTFTNKSSVNITASVTFSAADDAKKAMLDASSFATDSVAVKTIADRTKDDFSAAEYNNGTVTSEIAVDISKMIEDGPVSSTVFGTYNITLSEAAGDITYKLSNGTVLSTANLGTPSTYSYNENEYLGYSAFISTTAGASYNEAIAYVNLLNNNKYNGHTDWRLLADGWELETFLGSIGQNTSVFGSVSRIWTQEISLADQSVWGEIVSSGESYFSDNPDYKDESSGFMLICGK